MATINITTISRIEQATQKALSESQLRGHLGASQIGQSCNRAIWYDFHWASREEFTGRLLRLFERGQTEEDRFAKWLEMSGIEVHQINPETGKQFAWKTHGGHFSGSCDGFAKGLIEAPHKWHVLEFKTHNDKSFKRLEKEGVQLSKPQHFDQMQVYMHWSGIDRAYYMAVNKNDDSLYGERVSYNKTHAQSLVDKALRIIEASEPPERIGDASWYECKWCKHYATCHEQRLPEVNCRTCAFSTPELNGDRRWTCAYKYTTDLTLEQQANACDHHVFIPPLVPYEPVETTQTSVTYKMPSGNIFTNGGEFIHSKNLQTDLDVIQNTVFHNNAESALATTWELQTCN